MVEKYEGTHSGVYSIEMIDEMDVNYGGCKYIGTILGFVEDEDEAKKITDILNEQDAKILSLERELAKWLVVDAMKPSHDVAEEKEVIGTLKINDEPVYYNSNGLSPLEAFKKGLLSMEETCGFCKGNVIKYVIRAGKKNNASEDIDKAIDYLNHLKEICEGENL